MVSVHSVYFIMHANWICSPDILLLLWLARDNYVDHEVFLIRQRVLGCDRRRRRHCWFCAQAVYTVSCCWGELFRSATTMNISPHKQRSQTSVGGLYLYSYNRIVTGGQGGYEGAFGEYL